VKLVVLAGFLRIFSPWFPCAGGPPDQHPPVLLPCFKGLHVQRQALDAACGERCTVHFVIPDLDAGPIIARRRPVLADDTEETLSARILRQEHRLYPLVVRWFAEGVSPCAGRVAINGVRPDAALLFSPPLVGYKR